MSELTKIITTIGMQKQANCLYNNEAFRVASIVIGDGNGEMYEPTPNQTALRNQRNTLTISNFEAKSPVYRFLASLPADIEDYTIREVGLIDSDGDLVVISQFNCPTKLEYENLVQELTVGVQITLEQGLSVVLVDSNIITASKNYVDATLANYQLLSEKGISNGYAPLDEKSKVPLSNLPEFNLNGISTENETRLQGAQYTLNACKLDSNGKANLLDCGTSVATVNSPVFASASEAQNGVGGVTLSPASGYTMTRPEQSLQPVNTWFYFDLGAACVGINSMSFSTYFVPNYAPDATLVNLSGSVDGENWVTIHAAGLAAGTFSFPINNYRYVRFQTQAHGQYGYYGLYNLRFSYDKVVTAGQYLNFNVSDTDKLTLTNKNSTRQLASVANVDVSSLADGSYTPFVKDDNTVELISDYKVAKNTKGYDIVGTPTITDGVVSGFSTSNYLTIPNIDFGSGSWQFVTKATMPVAFPENNTSTIIRATSAEYNGFVVQYRSDNKLYFYASSNGTSWNIASASASTLTISSDTTKYIQVKFTGTQYLVNVSDTGEFNGEETNYITVTSSLIIKPATQYTIGCNYPLYTTSVFNGSIDLNETYIKKNDTLYWVANSGFENSVRLDNSILPLKLLKVVDGVEVEYNATPMTGAEVAIAGGAITNVKQPWLNVNDAKRELVDSYVNGTSWYNLYSDGWIEQGGQTSSTSGTTQRIISLLKKFINTNYSLCITCGAGGAPNGYLYSNNFQWTSKGISSFSAIAGCGENIIMSWQAKGY